MRKLMKLGGKLLLIGFFFSQALFLDGVKQLLSKENNDFLYRTIVNINDTITSKSKEVDLSKELLLSNHYQETQTVPLDFELPPYNNIEVIPDSEIKPTTPKPSAVYQPFQNIKRVYIYSTHQMEEYLDQNTVREAARYLANLLRKGGMVVDVEEADFVAYGKKQGWNYNDSYKVSRYFLTERLKSHQYDLIIDFHRDSLTREQTVKTINNVDYAKLMIVIGTLSPNFDAAYYKATTLSDNINQNKANIMKPVYKQYARYNQDFIENMMLLEVGSNNNKYQEVLNSLDVFAKGLLETKGE